MHIIILLCYFWIGLHATRNMSTTNNGSPVSYFLFLHNVSHVLKMGHFLTSTNEEVIYGGWGREPKCNDIGCSLNHMIYVNILFPLYFNILFQSSTKGLRVAELKVAYRVSHCNCQDVKCCHAVKMP